jgi:hypothetical protein
VLMGRRRGKVCFRGYGLCRLLTVLKDTVLWRSSQIKGRGSRFTPHANAWHTLLDRSTCRQLEGISNLWSSQNRCSVYASIQIQTDSYSFIVARTSFTIAANPYGQQTVLGHVVANRQTTATYHRWITLCQHCWFEGGSGASRRC